MKNDRVTSKGRKASGCRTSALVLGSLLSFIVAVALLRNFLAPVVPHMDPATPTHYFLPREDQNRNVLSCNFNRALETSTFHTLWSLPLQPCSLVKGWANPTTTGVMADTTHPELSFFTQTTDWMHLQLRIRAIPHRDGDRVQTMKIRLNKRTIGSVNVPTRWRTLSVAIPPGAVRKGVNRVAFSFAYRASQSSSGRNRSARPVYAVDLREVALTRPPTGWNDRFRTLRRVLRRGSNSSASAPTQVYDRTLQRYVLRRSGTLIMPIWITDQADLLELVISSSRADSAPTCEITLNLESAVSGKTLSRRFPALFQDGKHSVREEIPVASFAGETCIFWVDAGHYADEATLEISVPRIIERPASSDERPVTRARNPGDPELPDIVMITLDAARADHFSCYGYDRPTTPNIDRLAAESLVFTNAFALVPNTRRSVPTMITGLSFTNHQVTESDSTLSQAATTMAEYLFDAGYRTACFSASPNNSRAIGDDQGYEEFFELWNEVPRERSRDPHYLSARVLDWLDTIDNSRPLHLQLHFVPPHAPYQPAPEFDLFSDPLYNGACDGSPKYILSIDKRKQSFESDDMKQLIGLYDGNLRAADDAVEEVLSALRRRPRWENTVVLVTADHGEAFYEHRRMGHNNTVYDEMLHVPFILHIPGKTDSGNFDLDRLVTLADLTPTLLATASEQTDSGFDGFSLVEKSHDSRGPDSSFFIARTAHHTPTWGLRTHRFKVTLSNSGQGELYDLLEDPGEQHNLRFSDPELFTGLGLMLTRKLIEAPSLSGGKRISELPESDREMLEALGYVE
jgi:arylsulfatase A-like enzyme